MSNTVPHQPSLSDAARSDDPLAQRADQPLPEFQPHSPIEREIERSERASAALAATRALARAAFTDSQLAAEDAAAAGAAASDLDTSGWIRTEYAALDHTAGARALHDDSPGTLRTSGAAGRNLVGGTFNPGIASLQGRAFPGASIANSQIRTRTGAQARFLHEARHAPRAERVVAPAARGEQTQASGATHYDKPAVIPMLATPAAAPAVRPTTGVPAHGAASEPLKFALAAGLGAVLVLMGGGVAWKAGLLTHASPTNAALITPQVAAQAEAARLLAASPQDIVIAPAAATAPPSTRTDAEVDAALAAAARAAAVPVASVHAAGPARVARSLPEAAAPVAAVVAPKVVAAAPARVPAPARKDSVAAAIANAQARADRFLAAGGSAATPAAAPETKQAR